MARPLHNALVINSNLAQPILKAMGEGNPGNDMWSRLYYFGRKWYKPEHADSSKLGRHLVVPESRLTDITSSVYGFAIPDQVKLRVVATDAGTRHLPKAQRNIHERLAKLGRGVDLLIDANHEATEVTIDETDKPSRPWREKGLQWDIRGIAECEELDAYVSIEAYGVRGHATHATRNMAGLAILNHAEI
jgi:hypothetical protein